MKNAYAIGDLAGLMSKTCETIVNISMAINGAEQNDNDRLAESYIGILLNELENLQQGTLNLTELISENVTSRVDGDSGSAFFAGELNDDLGDKTDKNAAFVVETTDKEET